MRRLMMTSASAALAMAIAACSSTQREDPVIVDTNPVQEETVAVVDTNPVDTGAIREVEAPTRVVDTVTAAPVTGPAVGSLADFQVNVGDRVYFDLDQYRLSADAQSILQRQAAWLTSYPAVNILVAGNCDERGTREYNLALGERRASVVKDYLVGLGVDPARIQTVSYGKERPVAVGSNEAAWAQNRNGFTQILSGASS
ncbi:MAG: peptidoglycan-associated lipoprotein Pal [Pseudomonadota bacterium]